MCCGGTVIQVEKKVLSEGVHIVVGLIKLLKFNFKVHLEEFLT